MSPEYLDFVSNLQNKMQEITLGYVPGTIRHFFHGKKKNINCSRREDILIKYQYNPYTFIEHDSRGLIILTQNCPKEFLKDMIDYFKDINEDKIALEEIIIKDKTNEDVLEYKINFILQQFEKLQKKIYIYEDKTQTINKEISKIISLNTCDVQAINVNNNIKPIATNISVTQKLNIHNIPGIKYNTITQNIYPTTTTNISVSPNLNIIREIPGIKYNTITQNTYQKPYSQTQKVNSTPHVLTQNNIHHTTPIVNNNIQNKITTYAKHNTFKKLSFKNLSFKK